MSKGTESNSRRIVALALSVGALAAAPVAATQLESAQDQLQEIRAQFATAFTPGAIGGSIEFGPQSIEPGPNLSMITDGIIEGSAPGLIEG
jgi:hypothetical protein